MKIELAKRLTALPPYLFAELDRLREEVSARGLDVINLGIGDPDLPTPDPIVAVMQREVAEPAHHGYPPYQGTALFREAAARFMDRRFGVDLDPKEEVLTLIGSKEGIAHMPLAVVDPGQVVLVPDPGYPVYRAATIFAGGEPWPMPLREERGFLPDLASIPPEVASKAAMMIINYPNNPTAAIVRDGFFEEVVAFAREYNVIVCHDAAYSEIAFDGYRPPSFLQTPGAMDVGVEFHSLSKTLNMTGWRIGFCAGNAALVNGLGRIKTNVDSGVFKAVQATGAYALDHGLSEVGAICATYKRRRDIMLKALAGAGLKATAPVATFYIWARIPEGKTSVDFAKELIHATGVVVTPGTGFGSCGEGYVRFSLSTPEERLTEAAARIGALGGGT